MQDITPYKRPIPPASTPNPPAQQPVVQHSLPKLEPLLPSKSIVPKRRHRRLLWLVIVCIILVSIGACVTALVWYDSGLLPASSINQRVTVVIAQGTSPSDIANELYQKKLIKNATVFYWYLKFKNELGKLQAGTYLLSPTQSASEIAAQIVEGKVDTYNLTIVPGQTLADIKQALIRDGFVASDIDAAFSQQYDSPLLQSKPVNVNLEGYIFPDTYQITDQTTVQQLLQETFATFYTKLQSDNLLPVLAAKGFTLHQAITLASIISQEASDTTDRKQIAEVFEKRLSIGMPLGSDVTFIYAAKQLGVAPSPTLSSPYNTRINTGLPPGAISNFTLDALEAVAYPANGNYLYFVAGDDGTVHYATTEAEHEANIAKYCTKLCQ